jgi:hypothetical protein
VSLIGFHRLLIATAIAFCAGFGVWELRLFTRENRLSTLALGITFLVLALGLTVYLRRLNRILGYERQGRD